MFLARPFPTFSGDAIISLGTGSDADDLVRVRGGWNMWNVMLFFAYSILRHLANASIAPLLEAYGDIFIKPSIFTGIDRRGDQSSGVDCFGDDGFELLQGNNFTHRMNSSLSSLS